MRLVTAIGYLDDDLIEEAMDFPRKKEQAVRLRKDVDKKHAPWLKWGAIVACAACMIAVGAMLIPSILKRKESNPTKDARYKDFTLQAQELTAIVWPWEYRTVGEKYGTIVVDGMEYGNTNSKVSESMIKTTLGTFEVTGYDEYKEETHSIQAEGYELNDITASRSIAVKLEDGYYVFQNYAYQPASTLGELLDQVNLAEIIKLNWFEEQGGKSSDKRYALEDASYLWEVLSKECRDARFLEDQAWMTRDREYLSFSISSNALGIQNVALYITKDGYLWTNAFRWQTLYDIGEEAAGKIIQHCREHASEIEVKAFTNAIIGTITEITEEYFLVDDAVLCKDSKDGITYKVLLNDIRISRYVQKNYVKLGDTVEVLYRDQIDEENEHTIREATSASKVTIIDGKAYIFE
ncbi:MAG: hypothetical protein K5678_13800 [Acetatifactor sp.]|nr:hypothetical protein [Acetatifactor sp.]